MDYKNNILAKNLQIFFKLSSWIVFPVIIGVFIGKWLDHKYNTAPWLFLITLGITFIISMFGLITNTIKEFKKIDKLNNSKNKNIKKSNKENNKQELK